MSVKTTLTSVALAAFSLPAVASSIPIVNGTFDVINNEVNPAPITLTDPAAGYIYTTNFGTDVSFTKSSATGPDSGDLPGWVLSSNSNSTTTVGGVQLLGSNYVGQGTSSGLVGFLYDNNSGAPSVSLSQTLSADLLPDSTYTLSLAMAYRNDMGNPGSAFTVQLYAGGTQLFSDSPILTSTFQNYSFDYTSPSSGADIGQPLEIVFSSTSKTQQTLMDNVSLDVVSVPEPSTWALLPGGFALLAVWRNRNAHATRKYLRL